MREIWGKKRERETEREERETRDEREWGWKPRFIFSRRLMHARAQGAALKHGRDSDPSFRCIESALERGVARSSMAS